VTPKKKPAEPLTPEVRGVPDETEEPSNTVSLGSSELEARLADVEAQRDEYLRDLQRLAADFDNYRKRTAREQESIVARAHERLVKELLPVLDDLERALDAAEEHDEAAAQPPVRDSGPVEGVRGNREVPSASEHERLAAMAHGVSLVREALRQALEREGLVEIEADGAFDPHVHEALLAQPAEGREHGDVLEVIQKGYRLGDKVLRPARVVVAE